MFIQTEDYLIKLNEKIDLNEKNRDCLINDRILPLPENSIHNSEIKSQEIKSTEK